MLNNFRYRSGRTGSRRQRIVLTATRSAPNPASPIDRTGRAVAVRAGTGSGHGHQAHEIERARASSGTMNTADPQSDEGDPGG